jgi:hypothetical protein
MINLCYVFYFSISSAFLAALLAWQLLNMMTVFLAELAIFFMSDTKMKKELPQRHRGTENTE